MPKIGNGIFGVGDCFDLMAKLPDASVDMVLADLPYGTTRNKWDSVLPLDRLWAEYWRVCKPNAAVVLTAAQPFTSALVMSQMRHFKYDWIWQKSHSTGHLNANRMPMREHESVLIFARKRTAYNPQKQQKEAGKIRPFNKGAQTSTDCYGVNNPNAQRTDAEDVAFPKSIQKFNNAKAEGTGGIHPTQKPVALFEYLIRTYTNEGDTVLDNTAGSGTTAIAAERAGRKWICIERDEEYAAKAMERIRAAL